MKEDFKKTLDSWLNALKKGGDADATENFWHEADPKVYKLKSWEISEVTVTGKSIVIEKKDKIDNTARVKLRVTNDSGAVKDLDIGMVKVKGEWKLNSIREI